MREPLHSTTALLAPFRFPHTLQMQRDMSPREWAMSRIRADFKPSVQWRAHKDTIRCRA